MFMIFVSNLAEVPAEGGLLGIFLQRVKNKRVDLMNGMSQRAQGAIA